MSEEQGQTLKGGPENKVLHPTAKSNNHIMEDYHKADILQGDRETVLLHLLKGARPGSWGGTVLVEYLPLEELGCTYSGSLLPNLEGKSKFKEQLGFLIPRSRTSGLKEVPTITLVLAILFGAFFSTCLELVVTFIYLSLIVNIILKLNYIININCHCFFLFIWHGK